MKMDAYDTAVLSYALATAANKQKTSLLGLPVIPPGITRIPPNFANRGDDVSLTPPTRHSEGDETIDYRNIFYQLLCKFEQNIVSKTPVHLQQLMEMCSSKQSDTQTIVLLDTLQNELRQVCKHISGSTCVLTFEGDNPQTSLKTEAICKILLELCNKYGLKEGAYILKSYLS